MINWNGRRYVPAGLKPFLNRKGVPVNGRPKTAWVASFVGGETEETPIPSPSITPTPSPTLSPTPSPTLPETCHIEAQNGDILIAQNGDYIDHFPCIEPSPTPTPTSSITPTPSITPTITPTPSSIPLDPDAQAYLDDVVASGGTIDATITSAVDTLFTDLKSNGLYSKLHFYPFVGGTAASHALYHNRTLGTTYDISWLGGVSHDISGSTGNNTNGYGVHSLGRTIFSNLGDISQGVYVIGDGSADVSYELQSTGTDDNALITRYINDLAYVRYSSFITGTNTDGTGLYISTLTGSTGGVVKLIKNGSTTLINSTTNDNDYISSNSQIMRGPSSAYSPRTFNFVVYSTYLTDSEVSTLSTIINTFQTTLGRNTY
jgi:hypothetical protein